MITQSFMLNLASKLPQASTESVKKADIPDRNTYGQFNDILNRTVDKAPSNNTPAKRPEQTSSRKDDQRKDEVQEKQFKSFRELSRNDRKEIKAEKSDSTKETKDVSKDVKATADKKDNVKDSDTKADAIISSLAQVLGINPADLKALLGALNIKPEDLADKTKANEIVNKLSDLMGLNTDQKQTLSKLLETVNQQVDNSFEQLMANASEASKTDKPVNTQEAGKKDWVKVENSNIEVVNETKTPADHFKEIKDQFKMKLDELTQKIQQNPQKAIGEISDTIKEMLTKYTSETAKTDVKDAAQTEEIEPVLPQTAKPIKTVKESETKQEVGKVDTKSEKIEEATKGNSKDEGSSKDGLTDLKASNTKSVQADNGKTEDKSVQFNNVIANEVQKVSGTNEVSKVQKEVPIPKSDIINQVVEKAKVVLTGDKSEMLMDLKPDSLGKLSLKVVTERGIVMAKFVAENEQVKAVLEANMQTLKDSLEKQGMSIQGFSVSVGQDSSRGYNRDAEPGKNSNSDSNRINPIAQRMVNVSGVFDSQQKVNPYNWSDSKINLTA